MSNTANQTNSNLVRTIELAFRLRTSLGSTAKDFYAEMLDNLDRTEPAIDDVLESIQDYVFNNTLVYWHDLANWLNNTYNSDEYMERVVTDSLVDTGRDYSFWDHVSVARNQAVEDELSDHLVDLGAAFLAELIARRVEYIPQELADRIETCDIGALRVGFSSWSELSHDVDSLLEDYDLI